MRLSPRDQALLAVVLVAILGYAGWRSYRKHAQVAPPSETGEASGPKRPGPKRPPRAQNRIVIGVNDFGGAYPGLAANDGATAGARSRFSAAGLDVEIKLIRGAKERLSAFDSGDVDVMLLPLDAFASLAPAYEQKGEPLQVFLMADWSRGNLGIVAQPRLKSIDALKDAKIASTRHSPTHYFLFGLLGQKGLTDAELDKVRANLVFASKTPLAVEQWRRGEVDAVVLSEPLLSQLCADGKGRLLASTATAGELIAEVLFARQSFLETHEAEVEKLVRGWLDGVAAIEQDREAAVRIVARAYQQTPEETRATLRRIKPAGLADNRQLFGLDAERVAPGAPALYPRLFDDASRFWQREGVIDRPADALSTLRLGALRRLAAEHPLTPPIVRVDGGG